MAVIVALSLTVLLLAVSLALEVGYQRTKSRDMQALADVVALDLARRLDGQKTGLQAMPQLNQTLAHARVRNGATSSSISVNYILGRTGPAGEFITTDLSEKPTSVKVVATSSNSFSLVPREAVSERSAIASARVTAGGDCFKIGSYEGVLGTSGEKGLTAFFQKMFGQAITFGNTSAAANFNWRLVAGEKINMTAVGQRMGYPTIEAFREAEVNLKQFYKAMLDQQTADYPSSVTRAHLAVAHPMINNVGPLPMERILGKGLKGTIEANALDVLGGMMSYYNDHRSVNPNFDSTFSSVFSQGPTTISYDQGARHHCAEAGDTISTAGSRPGTQLYMALNGNLTPGNFTGRVRAPGLFDAPTNTSLGYMGMGAKVEPVEMKLTGMSCTDTTKTAVFDLTKGDILVELPARDLNGNQTGGTTWAQGQAVGDLAGYGNNLRVEWGFGLQFRASLDFAPSSNNVVTATREQLGTPRYIQGHEGKLSIDVTDAVNNFSSFRVLNNSGPWKEYNLTPAHQRQMKEAIAKAYVNHLFDRSNPNSFVNNYMSGSLGFGGSSVNGPSIIFDGEDISCGGSGGAVSVKLVG